MGRWSSYPSSSDLMVESYNELVDYIIVCRIKHMFTKIDIQSMIEEYGVDSYEELLFSEISEYMKNHYNVDMNYENYVYEARFEMIEYAIEHESKYIDPFALINTFFSCNTVFNLENEYQKQNYEKLFSLLNYSINTDWKDYYDNSYSLDDFKNDLKNNIFNTEETMWYKYFVSYYFERIFSDDKRSFKKDEYFEIGKKKYFNEL